MKEIFLNNSLDIIKKNNSDLDEIKLAELKYGLETFYMLCTKMIVIIALSLLLEIFKEFMLFIIFYTPLRSLGFGFHANSSLECWLISIPTFMLIPLLSKLIEFPTLLIHIVILFSIISFLFFAPADTKKRPLINTKKRLINKTALVLIGIVYLFVTVFIENSLLINTIMFACLWQSICVNPLSYKLFNQPYNNYKNYLKEV